MKLPKTEHTSRSWRIHDLTRDFRLEDVWELPTPGGPDDFPRLVQVVASFDPMSRGPWPVRALFAIRFQLGRLFGVDDQGTGPSGSAPSLSDRLPADLREGPSGPDSDTLPFASLYQLEDEWALEAVNRTVHGVLHLSWVPDGVGGYRGQMAILVKRNGMVGTAYMAAIKPFRYLIVYPLMTREFGRAWRASTERPIQ
ncbi:DUF2867 domain-containing protein [Rhodococcus tibetensis]|uniref:DUF2867 domain-containing protein n=1 Tax=Rhodococcus tibetensis TaxID=2965064 RepID=A0ABT1Q623_9NOCA|nr:DUF2867 domain-containing protein [Rhodococcus sp. FXJ9.536]MCQ4117713.1 DUF2867 domain-containing protein [Rhodococcus sp. FXJ9.536]